jgi:hypothetical protein
MQVGHPHQYLHPNTAGERLRKHIPEDANSPFGIKALPGEPSEMVQTHEFAADCFVKIDAAFRKFPMLADVFDCHAELLARSPHYSIDRSKLPNTFGSAKLGPTKSTNSNALRRAGFSRFSGSTRFHITASSPLPSLVCA